MKNKTYSIRRVSVGIASIIIGLSVWEIGTVNAAINSNISTSSKVIIDEDGVRPIAEPNPSENVKEELKRKPPIKSEEKPALKITEKPKEKPLGELLAKPTEKSPIKSAEKLKEKRSGESSDKPIEKPPIKPAEKLKEKPSGESSAKPTEKSPIKPAEKPKEKSLGELLAKPIEKSPIKPAEKPKEKPLGELLAKPTEKTPIKTVEKPIEQPPVKSIEKPTTNFLETDSNVEIKNDVLVGILSGREIKVSFKKGSISAEKLYVEPLNDNDLNQTIKNKLGSDYNIIETFEIHFEKDDKKVDSSVERTVTVAVVKKDNTELEVYHIADEDTLEKVNSSYGTGELKFNINHFSKFTIVERIKLGSKDLEERTKIVIPEKIENKEKENNELPETKSIKDEKQLKILPNTGISVKSFISTGFILLNVASIIRKKKNYI